MSDPIIFSILTRRIESVTRAMMSTLVRSSRSGVITSGHDCSCCIVTSGWELVSIAQPIPIHAMSGPDRMAEVMKEWHPNLKRGDAFLHNSPYHGCTHAADLCILVPVVTQRVVTDLRLSRKLIKQILAIPNRPRIWLRREISMKREH